MKTFALRVDLESQKGISKGLPKLLDLLAEFGFKASFYLTMGGESNIFELVKYKGRMTSSGMRSVKVFSVAEKARMALFPRDFVLENRDVLKRIISEGHELGIHGWKHREWTRGLGSIDIKKAFEKSVRKYARFFGKNPSSFCSPGFNSGKDVVEAAERFGIRVVSDFPGEMPFKISGTKITNVPITITGPKRTPIIEYLASKKMNDSEILDYIKEEIRVREFPSIYVHCMYECIEKIGLLREIFKYVGKEGIGVKTISEVSKVKGIKEFSIGSFQRPSK